jgi:hypothetical protein
VSAVAGAPRDLLDTSSGSPLVHGDHEALDPPGRRLRRRQGSAFNRRQGVSIEPASTLSAPALRWCGSLPTRHGSNPERQRRI